MTQFSNYAKSTVLDPRFVVIMAVATSLSIDWLKIHYALSSWILCGYTVDARFIDWVISVSNVECSRLCDVNF